MAEGYVFTISGDVSKYASELAKLPGITEKQASEAAIKMGAQFAKAQDKIAKDAAKNAASLADANAEVAGAVQKAASALSDNTAAGKENAAVTWEMKQGAMSLKKNVGDIFNALVAGQSPMTIFLQQGQDTTNALLASGDAAGVAKLAFGGMLAPIAANALLLGTLGGALAAGALAYKVYGAEARSEEHTSELQSH